jgi:hypothetical protein
MTLRRKALRTYTVAPKAAPLLPEGAGTDFSRFTGQPEPTQEMTR